MSNDVCHNDKQMSLQTYEELRLFNRKEEALRQTFLMRL